MRMSTASNAAYGPGSGGKAQGRHRRCGCLQVGRACRYQCSKLCRSFGTLVLHRAWTVLAGATRWQSLVTQHATCCAGPGGQRSITEGNGLRLTVLFTLAEFGCLLCRTLYRGIWTVLQHIQKEGSWTEVDCQGAGPGDQHVGAAK